MKEDKNAATSRLNRAAREEMKKWKLENGIKAILPKTVNQKAELRLYNKLTRAAERHEMRKISHGAASKGIIIEKESCCGE